MTITLSEPPPQPSELAPEEIPLSILFEDEHLIVIDKPPGLVVHPGPGNRDHTLVNALLHHCKNLSGIGGVERPGIVHRLDKETSGCLVIAKNDIAHRGLAEQFASRRTRKFYLALGSRTANFSEKAVDERIGRHPVHRKKMAVVAAPSGRDARTNFTTLHAAKDWSLFLCELFTGRTHQIRVHLKHLGFPILGDALYGGASKPPVPRIMLHSFRLGFHHPILNTPVNIEAPVPHDFASFLQVAEVEFKALIPSSPSSNLKTLLPGKF
jgi:23S rRNA pseudouridine1911/1915/1917 synthase